MREILFRGKRKDNGEWVEGGSIFRLMNKIGEHFFIPQFGEGLIATHDDNIMNIVALENMTMYRVIPETVGQYTGLKDKNGKKIFEGDIISRKTTIEKRIYRILFDEGAFCYLYDRNTFPLTDYEFGLYCEDVEVIGNIHDNPELLKEGEEE